MLKYLTLLTTSLLLLSLSSCKKPTQFDIEYQTQVVIPATTGIQLPLNFFTPEIETNSEQRFRVNDTRKDLIREIQLKQLKLNISNPSNGSFSVLKSINIYLNAEGLDEIKVAWKEDIPEDAGNELVLQTTGEDLQEYIKKDEFRIRVNTINRQFINQDYNVDVFAIYWVDAKLL